MNPEKRATALAIIKVEYAEHSHKTHRSVQVVVENGKKRKARNRAILEGLMIYDKRQRGWLCT